MRICLVAHGFPPVERTGVENYTLGLARALARARHRVEVFVTRRAPALAELALRREEREGFAVNWITKNLPPAGPREALLGPEVAGAFAAFLERERPEVVHFQHFIKLGIDLLEEARKRGIPTAYTAHDYYPICHRYTLLRPDLAHCDARGDSRACARCDRALGHLDSLPELGDFQMGVLSDQLPEAERAALAGLLSEPAPDDVGGREALDAAHALRAELDRARAEAYRGVDLLLSPSRFLIEEFVRAGIERERFVLMPFGFETADLAGLPPVRRDPKRPVRFAFLGGLSKHKGVHVLLEAFAELRSGAELSIWGDSSDRPYVERLRRRAGEVGALWRGAYERPDLPGILAEVDALVLPSVWVENYPLVIREGFAAGRPVLASRVGALPESVRDGVDGLFFAPGDVADLARVLQRCVEEPGLLPELARGIAPVKGIDAHAAELAACYARLCARPPAVAPRDTGLASLRAPLARHAELSRLPTRELFARALSGLEGLRRAWAAETGDVGAVELLAGGLGEGSGVQDGLREAKNEIGWLRAQREKTEAEVAWLRAGQKQSEAEIAWLRAGQKQSEAEIAWLRDGQKQSEIELGWLRAKHEEVQQQNEALLALWNDLESMLDELDTNQQQRAMIESATTYVRAKEAEVLAAHARQRELEELLASKDAHVRDVEEHVGRKEEHIREVEEHVGRQEAHIRAVEEELARRDEHLRAVEAELGRSEDQRRAAEGELSRRDEQVRAIGDQLGRKDEHLREVEGQLQDAGRYIQGKDQEFLDLQRGLEAAVADVGVKEAELGTAREQLASLEGGTRSVAELGLNALEFQARLLGRLLRPILRRLHRIQGAPGEPLLPTDGAPLMEVAGAMRHVMSGLAALEAELVRRRPMEAELTWRRERMEKLMQRAQHTFSRLTLAWTPVGRELRDWREPSSGGPR